LRNVAVWIPDGVIGIFFDIILRAALRHSAPNRDEYQEYFLRVKVAGV